MGDRVALPGEEVRASLRDGKPVVLRPIRPDDKALLVDGFDRLSEESRLRRFMAPIHELSTKQLAYLTEVDHVDHVALLAEPPHTGVGVGRYVRIAAEPDVAEAALTVVDDHQGLGLGTLLLGVLAGAARAGGITRFRAYAMEDNAPVRAFMESLGAHPAFDSPGVLRMDIPIDPDRVPDSPAGRVLKAVAARRVPVKAKLDL
jgi:GNAT superfamily N-acetyltransferase